MKKLAGIENTVLRLSAGKSGQSAIFSNYGVGSFEKIAIFRLIISRNVVLF